MRVASAFRCLLGAAGALLASPDPGLLAQSSWDVPPTILERWQEQRAKNPALEEKLKGAPSVMQRIAWMTGKWEVTEKTYATRTSPETTRKGGREAAFELDGRSLVARQDAGPLKTMEVLVYDPFRENWFLQILTNGSRGAVEPLVSRAGWENGALQFEGRLWLYGLNAEISLRIVKEGDDAYREVIEEKLPGNVVRPVFEFRYTRKAAAPGKAK